MQQVPQTKRFSIILPYFIIIVIDAMSIGMLTPILAKQVAQNQGLLASWSAANKHYLYSLLLGIGPLCFMLAAPIFGYFSDFFGRKRVLLCCICGTLLSFICYYFAFHWQMLSMLIVGRILDGATSGSQGVAQAAIADISHGNDKTNNIAFIAVAMTVGLVVGPFFGGLFSDSSICTLFTDQTPFVLAIILSFCNLFLLVKYLRETHQPSPQTKPQQVLSILKQKRNIILLTCFFVFELAWSLYFQSINLLLSERFALSKSMLGTFSLYIGVCLIIALLLITRLLLRFICRNNIIKMSFVLLIFAYSSIRFSSYHVQWLSAATIALAVACIYACLVATLSDAINAQKQGLMMGLCDGALACAFALSGFLSGALSYLNLNLPYLCCAVFSVVALYLYILTIRTSPQHIVAA